MKKYGIILVLILLLISLSVKAEEAVIDEEYDNRDYLENMQVQFYESPLSPLPEVKEQKKNRDFVIAGAEGEGDKELTSMTMFKRARIRLTNYYREREYKNAKKEIEKEKLRRQKELAKELGEDAEELSLEPVHVEEETKDGDSLELEGSVKEQVTSKDAQLDADNIDFDEKTMDMIATGSPVLYFPPQNTTIKADKMVYNHASNKLKAYGNVEVIRDGNVINGDYMQINMNEENAFMDNIRTKTAYLTVKSRTGEMDGDKVVLYDGSMVSENEYKLRLQTDMIGGNDFTNMYVEERDASQLYDLTGQRSINVKAKEIIVNAKKDHDTITFKNSKVSYGDVHLFNIRSFTAHTNKKHEFFEANYPELGNRSMIGMFAGPGFVFDTPLQNGSTLKLIPFVNYSSKIGVGGFLKYKSATNYTDFGYGSSKDVFILKGRQELDDNFYLQYGMNSFMDQWFIGPRMAKYDAELIYKKESRVPATLGKGRDLRFRQRAGFGYMHDSDYNYNGEHIPSSDLGTTRTRYMAEGTQTLFTLGDREERKYMTGYLVMQGSAALYGTGDTQFIGRIGPGIHTQYKYWMQDITYYMSTYQDGTPLRVYDSYRYGHGSVYIREALRLCKYLTIAWSGTFNLTDDSPDGRMMQENTFILGIGPDDFKLCIGYDWVREQTYAALVIALNTKGSKIDYDKLVIKNPDRLSKSDKEEVQLKVFDNPYGEPAPKAQPKKMKYAEVIEIEDPDKERI